MQDKCPKCGETLITKIIKKQLGHGSIDYPVSETCPKCGWNKDLTGAADIVSKPVMEETPKTKKESAKPAARTETKPPVKTEVKTAVKPAAQPKKQPEPGSSDVNKLIPIALAILVIGAIVWAFFLSPGAKDETISTPKPTATPEPVITKASPTATVTTTATSTPVPAITPITLTGKQIPIKLDSDRGFYPTVQSIKPGDEIVFSNTQAETITLVSVDGIFDQKVLANGKKYNNIFNKSGNYTFYLKENKNLTGTIVVEP